MLILTALLVAISSAPAVAQKVNNQQVDQLSQLPLDRWKKLREVERYQLKIAEKYYRTSKDYKVAKGEYEKYLTLYERSEAAPYAQLMLSNCHVRLKKLNTAIKDGYQSVIDYWPNSTEATTARYLIGRTQKQMGEVKSAKKTLREVVSKHPKHIVAVFALADLIDVTTIEKDDATRVALWKQLTFDIPRDTGRKARNSTRNRLCAAAAVNLARHDFQAVAFDDAVKALATAYSEQELPYYVYYYAYQAVNSLVSNTKTKLQGQKLADLAIGYIRQRIPADRKDEEKKKLALAYWYYIADLHSYARRDAKVLETYGQITKIFGSDDGILGRLAGWYRSRRRFDDARAIYAKFTNKLEGQNQTASSYWDEGKYLLAAGAYKAALALDPKDPVRWKPSVAYSYRYGKKHDEAIAVYHELIKDDAKDPERWRLEIARTHRDFGKYKEAVGVYRLCGTKFPTNYWEMAYCHRHLKQYKEAIVLYNQIAGGAKDAAPQANWEKAETYRAWKKKDLEISALRTICKRFPRNAFAARAHARLQRDYKINVTLGGAKDE